MRAGALRERMKAERPKITINPWGEQEDQWEPAFGFWASIRLQQSAEKAQQDGQTQTETRYEIKCRFRADFATTYRILWRGKALQILTIGDPDGKRRELLIVAAAYPELKGEYVEDTQP